MFWFTHWQNVFLKMVLKTAALKICRKYPIKEATVCRDDIFLNWVLHQIYFLGIYEITT